MLQQSYAPSFNSQTVQQNGKIDKVESHIPPEILLDTRHPEPIRHEIVESEKPLKSNDLENIDVKLNFHREPVTIADKVAYQVIKLIRLPVDWFFKKKYIHRAVVLETIAGVPGMVGGTVRHLQSLRKLKHDGEIDAGNIPNIKNIPDIAIDYWHLDRETATLRDLVLAVRADEAVHRDTNHHFADRIVLGREDLREDIKNIIANEPNRFGEKLGKIAGVSQDANEKWKWK
ncbi:8010_t:CDS:2 [Racocetra fulgida]|uniref:Alternative oxidase n=1 Tax=Racocetra fulgida TaxID=60492 RepID=A0A9N9BHP3_9GLOM|nr:8010_t:CDS:2 [Racocetra fulgida]